MKEERSKLHQELSCLASLNNKMMRELEILSSQDRRMKEKLASMEAALDKVILLPALRLQTYLLSPQGKEMGTYLIKNKTSASVLKHCLAVSPTV